ncbi:vacuolar protein [Cyanidiococcus yangmingshanensis]|uniref:Vacuolar protein n=1 Tax=Cyanidiococcus yangmingshanensis TaxID=2690220 RepID=A0A7J7IJ23_9RHOD|nr:vacuolar protein [Cyanidiococcus yangmingshanensis]
MDSRRLSSSMNIEQLTLRDLLSLRPDQDGAVRFRCGRQPDTDAVDPSKVAIAKSVPPATHAWSKGSASLLGVSPAERVAPSTCRQDRDRPETVYNARGSACLELKGLVQYASPSLPDAGARSPLHPEYDEQSSTSMESHQVAVALDMMVTAPEINYFHPFYALLVETILAWQAQACVIRPVPVWPSRDTTTEEAPGTCQVDRSRHRPGSRVEEYASLMQQASSTRTIQLKLHCLQPVLVFPSELDEAPLVLVMLEIARLKLDQQLAPSWSFSTPLPSSTTPNPSSGLSPVAHAEDAFEALVEQVSVLCLAQDPEHASVTFLEPVPLIEASIHWIRTSVCDRTAPEDESGFSRSVSVPQASKDLNDWSRTSMERMGVHEPGHEDPNVFQVTLQAQATELECHLSPSVVASLELVLLTNLLRAYGERRIPVSTRQRFRWAAELCFDRCLLFADADDDDVAAEQDATGSLSTREHLGNRRAALRGRETPHVSVNDSSATSHPMDMSRSAARAAHREQQTSTVLPRRRTRQRTTSDPGREPLLETPVTEANHPRDAKTSSRTQPSRSWRASPSRGRPLFSQTDSRRPRPSSLSLADSEDVDLSTSVLLDCRGFRGIVSMSLPQGDTEAHFMLAECQLWSRRDQADQPTDVVDLRPTASASTLHGRNEEPRPSPKTTMQPAAVATHSNVSVSMNETRRASVQRSKSRWRQVRSGLVLSSGSLSLDMELHPGHPLAFQFQVQEPIQLVLCGPRAVAVLDVLTQMILVLGEITASLRPYLELHSISMESLFETDGWDWSIQLPWIELLLLDQKTFGVDMQAGMGVQLEFHLSLRQTTNGRVQRLVAGVQELMLFRVWLQRQAAPNRWCWRGCVLYDIQDAPYFGSLMVVSAPTSGDDASVGTTSSQDVPTIQLVSEELRIRLGIDDLVLCQRAIDAMLNPLFQRMQSGQVRRAWQTRRLGSEAFRHRPSRSSRDAVESDAGPQQHFWRHRSGDRMSGSEWVASAPPHQEQRTPSQGRESQPYARLSTWFRSKLGRAFRVIERPGDAVGTRLDQGAPGDEQPWPRPEHARASSSSIPAEDDEPDRRSSAGNVLGEEASIGPGRNSLQDENQGPVLSTARTLPWQGSIAPIQCSLLDPFAEVPYALVSVALGIEELGITLEQDIGAVGVTLHCRLGMHTFALDRFVWDTLAEPCSLWMHLRAQVGRPADAFTLGVALDVLESIEFTMSDQLIHAIAQVDQRIRQDFAVEQRQVGIHRQAYQRQRVWVRWTSLRAEPTTLRIHNATEMALCLETQLQLMPLEIAPGSFVELSIPSALPSTCCWYSENDQQHADVAFRARLSIAGSSSLWAPVWLNLSHYGHQVLRLRSQAANPSRTLKTKESLSSWLASLDLLMISVLRGDHVEISFHSPVLLRNRSGERLWLQVQVSASGSLLLDSFSSSVSSDQELDMRWRSALQWYWTNLSAIDAPALSGKRRLAAAAARSADRPAGMEVWQRSAASEHDRLTDSKALVLETIVPKNGAISLPVGWLALNGQLRLAGMPTTRRGHARHGLVKPTGQLDEQHTHLDAGHDDACSMPAEPMACPVDADHISLLTASLLEDAKTAAIATATDLPLTSSLPSIEGAAHHRSSFYASLRGFKTRSGRCWLELTITPVVKLLNALPYSARLGLIQGDLVVAELFLASGQEASALHVDWMQPWRMEWSISRPDDEYRCCAPLPFPSLALGTRLAEQGNGQVWHLDLLFVGQRTQLHRWWRLQLVRQEHSEESSARWLITLTANYWLLNFTDLPLTAMPLNHGLAAEDRRRWYRLWSRCGYPASTGTGRRDRCRDQLVDSPPLQPRWGDVRATSLARTWRALLCSSRSPGQHPNWEQNLHLNPWVSWLDDR